MHLLIVAIGSAGDVHPFLAIGRAALLRGHRVTVCTSPFFQPLVESCGLRFLPLGSAQEYTQAMADPRLWAPRTSLRTLWGVIAQTLEVVYAVTERESAGQTVVLGSLWAFGARVVQERSGVPYLCAHVSPSTLLSAIAPPEHGGLSIPSWWPLVLRRGALRLAERLLIDRLMAPAVNRLRRRVGLPPTRRVMTRWMHSPDGVLALFPPWFAPAQADWPQALSFTGFPLFDAPGQQPLDDELSAFLAAGPKPVVVTAGSTLLSGGATFFANTLAALAARGSRAILLVSAEAELPALPTWALRRAYVPLSQLLPHCAAIVHHGGIGTVAAALRAGLPQLVLPFAHDQFDNAARVVALGAGRRLRADAYAQSILAALSRLVGSESQQSACDNLARLTEADGGERACDHALAVIEQLAATRWPAPPTHDRDLGQPHTQPAAA